MKIEDRKDYLRTRLDNGLTVVAVPDPRLHYFSVAAFVAMGPRFEPLPDTGVSHFIEHMVFQGTRRYPTGAAITAAVDRITGQILATTSPEYCLFGLSVHRKYRREAIDMLAEILQRPLFDPREIEQEKLIILEERAEYHDKSQRNLSVDELLYNLLTHPSDEDLAIVGTAANISRFDREKLLDYWRRFFTAGNMVVAVSGAFDLDPTVSALAEAFADLPVGEPVRAQESQGPCRGPRAVFRRHESLMANVTLAWRAVAFDHPDYSAYAAISEFLGAGTNSMLFGRVREELGLVYDISSALVSGSRFGWFEVDTTVGRRNYICTLNEILNTIDDFLERPVTADDLATCREKLKCSLEIANDDPSETASWYARQNLLMGPDRIISLAEELDQIDELSADRIAQVGRELFSPDNCYMIVVGPLGWLGRYRTRRVLATL